MLLTVRETAERQAITGRKNSIDCITASGYSVITASRSTPARR